MSNNSAGLHLFFDTTEVLGGVDGGIIGAIGTKRLRELADQIDSKLYVPDLVLDEAAYRRFHHIEERLTKLKTAAERLATEFTTTIEALPGRENTRARVRKELQEALDGVGVKIVPTTLVRLEDVLELSKNRVPPFGKDHDPRGFHDAVILLSTLKFAQSVGITECLFVSGDDDHENQAVAGLGRKYGVTCQLLKGTKEAIAIMEALAAAHVKSVVDGVVQWLSDYMNAHRGNVDRYLAENPPKVRDFLPHLRGRPLKFVAWTLGEIWALPGRTTQGDGPLPIIFFVDIRGEFIVQEIMWSEDPLAELEARPGTIFAPGTGQRGLAGAVGPLVPGPMPIPRQTNESVTVRFTGVAMSQMEGGELVVPPTITSLTPAAPLPAPLLLEG